MGDVEGRYCIGNVARGENLIPGERPNAVIRLVTASVPCFCAGQAYSTANVLAGSPK